MNSDDYVDKFFESKWMKKYARLFSVCWPLRNLSRATAWPLCIFNLSTAKCKTIRNTTIGEALPDLNVEGWWRFVTASSPTRKWCSQWWTQKLQPIFLQHIPPLTASISNQQLNMSVSILLRPQRCRHWCAQTTWFLNISTGSLNIVSECTLSRNLVWQLCWVH